MSPPPRGRQLVRTLLLPGEEWSDETGRNLERFLGEEINADRPWPRILQSLMTGSGRASAFRAQFREAPTEVAGAIGRGMLGVRLRCARCHDDPVHGWTIDDYYGLTGVAPTTLATAASLGALDRPSAGASPGHGGAVTDLSPAGHSLVR